MIGVRVWFSFIFVFQRVTVCLNGLHGEELITRRKSNNLVSYFSEMNYFVRLIESRQRQQRRHAAGQCPCLLSVQDECLFIPVYDPNEQDQVMGQPEEEFDEAQDEEWNPLIEWLQRPNIGVYQFADLVPPVLNYLQSKENLKLEPRLLTVADIKVTDLVFYYNHVWNRN